MQKPKEPYIAAIIIVAAAVMLAGISMLYPRKAPVPPAETKVGPMMKIDLNTPPPGFPENFPVPPGATPLNNFNIKNASGTEQATRIFASDKSVDTNFAFYESYLKDKANNWYVVSEKTGDPAKKLITARNSDGLLTVNVSALGKGSQVNLTFLKISFTQK